MDDEQAEDHGENGAAPEPEPNLDQVEPELLATFTEIGIVETRQAIEAILMVATDPTPASLLAQLIEVPVEHVELLCHALADSYEEANHGFQLVKVAGGWRFQTHPDMALYVERFAMDGQSSKLSNAALETLAIVAYKQPISRAQVSAIRGVNVDAVLRTLVQRGYVDEVGRDTGAGQAVLFGTTSMFLERVGINTVADLPALGDFVPSAEVVEALEQTLKVDLDPDLVTTDPDGDDGPAARPPTPSPEPSDEAEPSDPADPTGADADVATGDGEPDADATTNAAQAEGSTEAPLAEDSETDADAAPEAEAGDGVVAEADAEADDQAGAESSEATVAGDEAGADDAAEGGAEAEGGAGDDVIGEDVGSEPADPVEGVVVGEESDFPREIDASVIEGGATSEAPAADGEAAGIGEQQDFPREIDRPVGDAPGAVVEKAEPAAAGAGVERAPQAARPVNERVAEQAGEPATASPASVAAPEGVVVDAQASPKSGADRTDLPLGPVGQPAGRQAGGGEPGVADPSSAPVAGPGAGDVVAVDEPSADLPAVLKLDAGPRAGHAGAGGLSGHADGTQGDSGGGEPAGSTRPGPNDGGPDPAAGRVGHEVPAGDGRVIDVRHPAGAAAPTPAAGGQPSPQPDADVAEGWPTDGRNQPVGHQPERHAGPAADHGVPDRPAVGGATAATVPGGPGLAGPADPTIPPAAGPGPDLTADEPVVDLRPPLDLTDHPATPAAPSSAGGTAGPDADRA